MRISEIWHLSGTREFSLKSSGVGLSVQAKRPDPHGLCGYHLRDEGMLVPAIRPPTVAPGTCRLRVTLSAAHTPAQVDALAAALHALTG